MAKIIQEIFFEPPIVIARLGGSTTPLAAYSWAISPDPRNDDDTVIIPDWSFDILPDGSLSPFKPDSIRFRDGDLIRPTCPFIEVWVRMGEPGSDRTSWSEDPLTEALLRAAGGDRSALTFTVDARNAKAARRVPNPDLIYGLFPSVHVPGDRHDPVALFAVNPPAITRPMIPPGRHIPLGTVQVIRPRPNPSTPQGWPDTIDLDVIRLRFTPGRGEFYGPRQAANPTRESPVPAVKPENAFLESGAGWFNSLGEGGGFIEPSDTFDFFAVGRAAHSLGVVDDTCEARIHVELKLAGAAAPLLSAHANVLVGPPDFAPDRRPFLSIADDLNDRSADADARNAQLQGADLDRWVEDLFERAYETVSLMNVDFWRSTRGIRRLAPGKLGSAIAGDAVAPRDQAMGSRDKLRAADIQIEAPSNDHPLPLAERARDRHRSISDVNTLKDLVFAHPNRLEELVRGPFESEADEDGDRTTMRMPPFMRHSNANPLTIVGWQYDLLMRWAAGVGGQPATGGAGGAIATRRGSWRAQTNVRRGVATPGPGSPPVRLKEMIMSEAARIAPIGSSAPLHYRFRSSIGEHVLVVPYSRIFDVVADECESAPTSIDYELLASAMGDTLPGEAPLDVVAEPAPQSISLNVSSSCNLTCSYCYAARGGFNGAQTTPMDWPIARAAVDRLIEIAHGAAPITIGFLGGEPFANRELIHRTVNYSVELARARGLDIRFSVTTNGTLLTTADLELFRAHPFAVTISLDGVQAVHDRHRPLHRDGSGSWRTAIDRMSSLLERPGNAKIAARATVVRGDMDIANWIETLSAAGFPEVGVAPLRAGPPGSGALEDVDWPRYMTALIDASKLELQRIRQGLPIRLTNLAVALKQLHRGASSPYPCGAGGGYFSVSARGRWYACHRAIGHADFELGTNDGLDVERRRDFLARRHVHAQTDCGQCWARYLCSGGCHQEADARSAASCDFIREWLAFCLIAYCELGALGDARP